MRAVYGAYEGYCPLLNERLEVYIVDGGEGEVEQVTCERRYGGEVSVEEYGMEYCCAKVSYTHVKTWTAGKRRN